MKPVLKFVFVTLCGFVVASGQDFCSFEDVSYSNRVKEPCYYIHDSTVPPDAGDIILKETCLQTKQLGDAGGLGTLWKGSLEQAHIILLPRAGFKSLELLYCPEGSHQFRSLRIFNSPYDHVEEKSKLYRGFPFIEGVFYSVSFIFYPAHGIRISKMDPVKGEDTFSFLLSPSEEDKMQVSCLRGIIQVSNSPSVFKIRGEGSSEWFLLRKEKCQGAFMNDTQLFCQFLVNSLARKVQGVELAFDEINTLEQRPEHAARDEREHEHSQDDHEHSPGPREAKAEDTATNTVPLLVVISLSVGIGLTVYFIYKLSKKCPGRQFGYNTNTYEAESSVHFTDTHRHPEVGCVNGVLKLDTPSGNPQDESGCPGEQDTNSLSRRAEKLSTIEEQSGEREPTVRYSTHGEEGVSLGGLRSPTNSSKNNLLTEDQLGADHTAEEVNNTDHTPDH